MPKWDILPDELEYLQAPAERYGCHQVHEEILEFIQSITPKITEELEYVARDIATRQHESLIMSWLDQYPLDQFEESALVYFLLGILDELDLSVTPVPGDEDAGAFLRKRWETDHIHSFVSLAEETLEKMPFEEGRRLAIRGLDRVPKNRLYDSIVVLGMFAAEDNLNWIEDHLCDPLTGEWGHVAALSRISWQRIEKWLDSGRPLSLIALDAMYSCYDYDTDLLQAARPRVKDAPAPEIITARLHQYAQFDPVFRVERRVRQITDHLEEIVDSD